MLATEKARSTRMDPDANLKEQLGIAERILCGKYKESHGDAREQLEDAHRLAELVEALNGWLEAGGFLPKAWDVCE